MSRQRFMKLDPEERKIDWKMTEDEYYWNFNMYKVKDVPQKWRLICIQGYFFVEDQNLTPDIKVKIGVISRRQYKRGGTRLNARGIDDEGFVGNFVETESFYILNNKLCIFTQIRGSIPLFWKQEGLKGIVKFKRDPQNTVGVFKKHFNYCKEKYGQILMINLLKEKSEREQLLSINVKLLFDSNKDIKGVTYFHYDFHQQGIKNLRKIMEGSDKFIDSIGYYSENLETQTVLTNQNGVVRTNCMD